MIALSSTDFYDSLGTNDESTQEDKRSLNMKRRTMYSTLWYICSTLVLQLT